jgi:hypothetical protein
MVESGSIKMTDFQKLSLLLWAIIGIGTCIGFFSDNLSVKNFGAGMWFAGAVMQGVIGFYLIVRRLRH